MTAEVGSPPGERSPAARRSHWLLVFVVLAFVSLFLAALAGCGSEPASEYTYRPPEDSGDGLAVGSLQEVGLDLEPLGQAADRIRAGKYGEVHSLLVFKDGKLVFEEYFPGHDYQWDGPGYYGDWVDWDQSRVHNIHSAGKSITSACVGIAIEEGFIESVDQSIFDYLPDHRHLETDGKDQITIEHLLTMTSGLAWDEWDVPYGNLENDLIRLFVDCDDQVACILEAPLVSEPGTDFTYTGGGMILLGEIVRNATGMDIEAFSGKYLFEPLGIDPPEWQRFDSGVIYAGGDQYLTPREMVKFGATYLNHGVWDGQRIVSEQWVEHSEAPYDGPDNSWLNSFLRPIPPGQGIWGRRGYSYTWWTHQFREGGEDVPIYWAGGWGGQRIIVLPNQDAVVVFTGANYNSAPKSLQILKDYVIPAIH